MDSASFTVEPDTGPLLKELRKRILALDASEIKGGFWLASASDAVCLRFIRGNHFNPDEAFQRMLDTAKWRWEYGVDELFKRYDKDESPASVILEGHWPRGVTGKDKRGRPVIYNHLTAVDFPALMEQVGMEALTAFTVFEFERQLRANPEGGSIMIFDLGLDGLSATFAEVRAWIQAMMLYVKKLSWLSDFYPELSSRIYFTRAPKLFYGTFKVAESFLPDRTIRKVKVLHGDALAALLDDMDVTCVPPELGGKCAVVVGLGGRLPPDAVHDQGFMAEMRQRRDLVRGSTTSGNKERFSLIRPEKEEKALQESLALELLKEQIALAKRKSAGAEQRGSWKFDPGLDVLDETPDDVLLRELKNENFDPARTLERLKREAAVKANLKVPQEQEDKLIEAAKEAAAKDGGGAPGLAGGDDKKCVVM